MSERQVIISIKPAFCKLIFSGQKKWEYRKAIFQEQGVKKIIVYATAPISLVVGEFETGLILKASPSEIWEKTKDGAGISREFFNDYFAGKDFARAIEIKNAKAYENGIKLYDGYGISQAPQNFAYADKQFMKITKLLGLGRKGYGEKK